MLLPLRICLLAVFLAMSPPTRAEDPRPAELLPLRIASVVPAFRMNAVGPEFIVTVVNEGSTPIPGNDVDDSVVVELGRVRYRRYEGMGAILDHRITDALEPGKARPVSVLLGHFGAPLGAGESSVTILVGGVRAPTTSFYWYADRRPECMGVPPMPRGSAAVQPLGPDGRARAERTVAPAAQHVLGRHTNGP